MTVSRALMLAGAATHALGSLLAMPGYGLMALGEWLECLGRRRRGASSPFEVDESYVGKFPKVVLDGDDTGVLSES